MSRRAYEVQFFFFFSSRRRHTRLQGDWSSDVCSSDLRCRTDRADAIGKADPAREQKGADTPSAQPDRRWYRSLFPKPNGVGLARQIRDKIGRASCRGRGEISGGAGSLKKKKKKKNKIRNRRKKNQGEMERGCCRGE